MLTGARILVADDDPDLLSIIVEVLRSSGAEVISAASGAELVDHLADEAPFDLIVTDVAMPELTGLQAVRAVRTAGVGTPVLVITALGEEALSAHVKALGGNVALLRKPFEVGELESTAAKLIGAGRGTNAEGGREHLSEHRHHGA